MINPPLHTASIPEKKKKRGKKQYFSQRCDGAQSNKRSYFSLALVILASRHHPRLQSAATSVWQQTPQEVLSFEVLTLMQKIKTKSIKKIIFFHTKGALV